VSDASKSRALKIVICLLALYFIWGSTYIAMRFAIDSFPPIMMAAIRFCSAGILLYSWLRLRGVPAPTRREWLGASVVGILLLSIGNATVAYAEQTVSSGVAALTIATVPLWVALFSWLWNQKPTLREWLGILIGTLGVVVLNSGANFQASPIGAILVLIGSMCWSLGSIWGKHLPMARGAMGSASQMLAGGVVLVVASTVAGESWPATLTSKSVLAELYLIVFGSLVAYSAYMFLLRNVRPALATSNAFVNPVVALLLGVFLADERVGQAEITALIIILCSVLLVLPIGKKSTN